MADVKHPASSAGEKTEFTNLMDKTAIGVVAEEAKSFIRCSKQKMEAMKQDASTD